MFSDKYTFYIHRQHPGKISNSEMAEAITLNTIFIE